MRLFDFSLRFNGYDISKAKEKLKSIQSLNSKEKEIDILKRRDDIIRYHINNNPYYKNHILKQYNGNWDTVPVMTKSDLQKPLKERLSSGFSPKNVYVNKTSGSSGDPFIFAKDKWCHAMTWAQIMDRFKWYDIDFNHSFQARFYGIPLDAIGYRKERIKDYFAHRYRFSVFDLSDLAFDSCLNKFGAKEFDYINGYTSSIVQFAKYLIRNNIVLKDVCPSLKACIVTSEMLFDSDRELMIKAFGIPVINEYGASELDLIAFENLNGQLQVNSDTLYVEILDDENRLVPYGTEGRVVITSLFNKAHPFIRYDIGDIGTLDKSSSLIKPILHSLTGRTNDIVQLPSGRKAAGLTFYYVTKSVIEESGNVKEFVIEQSKLDEFKISYTSVAEINTLQKQKIESAIDAYLESNLKIIYNRVDKLKRTKSGKLKQFISKI